MHLYELYFINRGKNKATYTFFYNTFNFVVGQPFLKKKKIFDIQYSNNQQREHVSIKCDAIDLRWNKMWLVCFAFITKMLHGTLI